MTAPGIAVALLLTLLLWLPFGARCLGRRRGLLWLALPIAGAAFLPGVLWVQVPAQALVGNWLTSVISPFILEAWPVLAATPLALLAGLVQESVCLLALLFALRLRARGREDALWTGALAGAGVSLTETAWLLGALPAARLALFSTVVLERLFADAFHVGAGALLGRGVGTRRGWAAWLWAVLLHALIDTGAALYQMGRLSYPPTLAATAVVGCGLYLALLVSRRRACVRRDFAHEG